MTKQIRNVAVIAHVDHGKTTLVDALLKQTKTFRDNQSEMKQELIMDSSDQERERGITITAKITAVEYQDTHINIIDTPGHADFGGEVERTLHMADGCLLIVDAQEGPMPQTRFVLAKALELGLRPIVIINKIDKPAAQVEVVEDEVANLFLELATNDDQLHYETYYAIGRDGKAWDKMPDNKDSEADITPILEAILHKVPEPSVSDGTGLQLLTTSLEWDNYEGLYVIGKVHRGSIKAGQAVVVIGDNQTSGKVDKIYGFAGLGRQSQDSAEAGEIIAISGLKNVKIGQTVTSPDNPEALPTLVLTPPTLRMYLGPNTSPFKGHEGEFTTSRQIGERLQRELQTNIGLRIHPENIGYIVEGRGELHLSVLIESMRREGYEFEVGRPQVVLRELDGVLSEPFEEVTIEVPPEHAGTVQSEFGKRRAELVEQSQTPTGNTRLRYELPTKNLLGARSNLITDTKGTIVMTSATLDYRPKTPAISQERNGVLIAFEQGTTTPYALEKAESRGVLYISAGQEVYAGQIVGLCSQRGDLEVNVCKEKHLTNIRSSSSDGTVQLTPATTLSLEQSLDFIEEDEFLEVTPQSLRLRKRELNHSKRK